MAAQKPPSFTFDAHGGVSDAMRDAWERDGAVCVRGLFNSAELDAVRAGIDHVLAHPSPSAIVASASDDAGLFVEDFCRDDVAQFSDVCRNSAAARVAGELLRASRVRLYHTHVLVKEPRTAAATPWHQDEPYYNIEGMQTLSAWCPVDDVPRASSLQLLAGSHRTGPFLPRTFKDGRAAWWPEGSLPELPPLPPPGVAALSAPPPGQRVLSWAMTPGDAVLFHFRTVHGAGGVAGEGRRRVLSIRFTGDDVVHAPRPWRTSPQFDGLDTELPAGAPLEHARFPLLWARDSSAACVV